MKDLLRKFPSTRLRRNRLKSGLRSILAESNITVDDLIQPIFVKENLSGYEPISSMPDVNRIGEDVLKLELQKIVDVGIKAIAVFPVIDEKKKDPLGSEALKQDNFLNNSISKIKDLFPELITIADVALDPYTDHGHDGVLNDSGDVDNDSSLESLKKQALFLAKAGADVVAPSDMMDGRIKAIRDTLESENFKDTVILSYAAKYSSKFYGPFKDAVESAKFFGNKTKDTYQMSPSNKLEALHEVAMDINEGADIVMVKPGMPYLDIVSSVKETFKIPTFVYQVSGEYSMLKGAIANGWLSEDVIKESLISFKRAGADCILTYSAYEIAKDL
ncbi:MAG: porphobilinogen synthase [Proteobacteria bacterium]|jgi:porphobilinogen synthase|nr:porphobilinogen synthase [Pseudomonadota bacterium]RZO98919.1 MAG: porphobilinogen synthase [Gammaproteobacteria bacterium]|tara:strand:+ start:2001 stop:2996 length:996 start_codon:yes stop_codon:yes gene_type:complete